MTRNPRFTDEEIDHEIELLGLIERDKRHSWLRFMKRFFIRTCRILVGVALGCGAYLLYDSASEITDIPFASLTLREVFWGIGSATIALFLVFGAWEAAFGLAPTEAEKHESHRQEALASLTIKHPVGLSIKTVDYSIDPTGYLEED